MFWFSRKQKVLSSYWPPASVAAESERVSEREREREGEGERGTAILTSCNIIFLSLVVRSSPANGPNPPSFTSVHGRSKSVGISVSTEVYNILTSLLLCFSVNLLQV